jgi:hypothetical protein
MTNLEIHPIPFNPVLMHVMDHRVFQENEFIIPRADLGPSYVRQPGTSSP